MSKIDFLGRIVIPKPLREAVGLTEGTPVTFDLPEGGVFLRAGAKHCVFCKEKESLLSYGEKHVCKACLHALQEAAKRAPIEEN